MIDSKLFMTYLGILVLLGVYFWVFIKISENFEDTPFLIKARKELIRISWVRAKVLPMIFWFANSILMDASYENRLKTIEMANYLLKEKPWKKIYQNIELVKTIAEWNSFYPLNDKILVDLLDEYVGKINKEIQHKCK